MIGTQPGSSLRSLLPTGTPRLFDVADKPAALIESGHAISTLGGVALTDAGARKAMTENVR